MNFRKLSYCLVLFLGCTLIARAQKGASPLEPCVEMKNKKAVEWYEKGIDKKHYRKDERMKFLENALALEPDYMEANFQYGMETIRTLITQNKPFKPAEPYFNKVVQLCPHYHSNPYYYLGFSYYEQEMYDSCKVYLDKFMKFTDDNDLKFDDRYEAFQVQAKEMLKYAKFYSEIYKKVVPFDPSPVGGICTVRQEYLPIISPDDEMMMFTRQMPFQSKDRVWQTDKEAEFFCFAKRDKTTGQFDEGKPMPSPFNTNENEGGATLTVDNKQIYFTVCKDEGGAQMNCDIYYSSLLPSGEWSDIKKVPGINDPIAWDSQPSIGADGKTLFFASDRKGGLGGCDIYKTVRDATGVWSKPVNLGPVINTPGNEKSPFMHSDSETLYFSSDGQLGLGGFDIFYCRKNDKGDWTTPVNIGYPINTVSDDLGFFVSTDGKLGYFATKDKSKVKGKGVGGWDIYSFPLYREARPDHVAILKGIMQDESGRPLENAKIDIKDTKTKEKFEAVVDSVTGEYAAIVNLKKSKNVIMTVKKDNYAFNSQVVNLPDSDFTKTAVNFDSREIQVGQTYTLNNIYYETNSADLKPESMIVLDQFVDFLNENPGVKIEIHGHTDDVGSDFGNEALSYDRAFTVLEALQQKGVAKERLVAFKGFGKNAPVASNETAEGRAKNRRTEFVIISK